MYSVSQSQASTIFSLGTNSAYFVALNDTGEITITSEAEQDRKYVINVTATEGGSPALDAATDATVRIYTYKPDNVIIYNYYLGIARSTFLARESTFLTQLTDVYQGAYPGAVARRQCVTARSSSACIVHTYVIENANETDDQSEIGNAKVFLTADDAYAVTSGDDAGTLASSLTGSAWTQFAMNSVGKYSDTSSSSESWITTPVGIGTLCAIATLSIAGIVGAIVAVLKTKAFGATVKRTTVHPI